MEYEADKQSPDLDYNSKEYWSKELQASEKALEKFKKQGRKTVERYLDKRDTRRIGIQSLNLFHSNIVTVKAMMFGQTPRVEVDRRYEDPNDDVARVATLILERMLNNDIQFEDSNSFAESLRYGLEDFLLPGLGVCRVRYDYMAERLEVEAEIEGETVLHEVEELKDEWCDIEYVHWNDFLWTAGARTWSEVRWVAFRTFIRKEEARARWGDDVANGLNFKTTKGDRENIDPDNKDPQEVAEIWEIWCKDSESVHWFAKSYDKMLGQEEDPLDLENFFPLPQPMMANLTTSALIPTCDYYFAQDLYNEIDLLETRISLLTKAVKAVGVYDKAAEGVKRMLQEGVDNDLIPVDNWAMFAEKGGLQGQIDWMPLDAIVGAITQLQQLRDNTVQLLYQSTGLSDIMRGQASAAGTSATEQNLKAKFASTRIQAMQDGFALFATELQKLKAQVISKHYSPETILKQSNIMMTPDAQFAEQAIALIKDSEQAIWRIQVRPESVAMVDYAQMKQDRMEYINSLAMFMQSAAPLAALDKGITPYLIDLLKWGLAGFKGSQQIEGVLDQAVDAAKKSLEQAAQQPPEPDPKAEAAKAKAELDKQKAQMDAQFATQKFQMEMQQSQQKFQQDMAQDQAKFAQDMKQMMMQMQTKNETARMDMVYNVAQKEAEVAADNRRIVNGA
jgi:hypothetical protein